MTVETPTNDEDYFTGIPTTPADLYAIMLFFLSLYLVGDCFCSRILKIVPSLVGYILVGIAFGPEGFGLLSIGGINSAVETLVVLGNLGLVLLIVQAGVEMEYETLRIVGLRGVIIAIVGTILPVSIGTAIASRYLDDWRSALAAGCSFGPTSAGIAMNVLGQCRTVVSSSSTPYAPKTQTFKDTDKDNSECKDSISNTERTILQLPVGQLIVAAAIVDDILALVVLSQLQSLKPVATIQSSDEKISTANKMVMDMAIPIVSAFLWLVAGGAIALWVFPKVLASFVEGASSRFPKFRDVNGDTKSLMVLFGLLYALLPATYYSRASYLLGAFLSGLAFCQDRTGVDKLFRKQFKRPMSYLMKLFFSASIGFQVPVRSFGDTKIIGRGFLFVLALMGKLAVGLLTPNFYGHRDTCDDGRETNDKRSMKRFCRRHLRDCFVVGFSMMGEAEFAFVVAVYGVSEGLVTPSVYASIVWAILLSTVISPLLLKTTLAFFPYNCDVSSNAKTCEEQEGEEKEISL